MSTTLVPQEARPLSFQGRRANVEVRDARRPARRAAARVHAASLVAHVGLANVEALTALEVQIARRQGAVVDHRVREIVDGYAGLVVTELSRLSFCGE